MPGWVERLWYGASPWRWLLWPLSLLFLGGVSARRAAYRLGLFRVQQVPLPVVVVGNLTVGGSGKTPLVLWLLQALSARGIRAGVVSRGYGGRPHRQPRLVDPTDRAADVGDEPLLIARRSGAPVVVCQARAAAVRRLAEEGVALAISDDGLQHYAMPRAVELAVVDGERGLGNGLCLPAGPLREPPPRLAEVDAVVVNGGRTLPAGLPLARTLRMRLVPGALQPLAGGHARALNTLEGVTVHAVAGIGHPQRFFRLLAELGARVIAHPLPDHAPLRRQDLEFPDAHPVIMTEKDAVRCEGWSRPGVWWLPVEAEIAEIQADALLERLLLGTGLTGEEGSGG